MSAPATPEQHAEPGQPKPGDRKRPPSWIVIGLLVLLGGWFVVTQVIQRTGPRIAWIHDDLAKAEQLARASNRRIFLLLHEPGCQTTAGNERNLFSQRVVRQRLARMVCCRIALKPDDPLRRRFYFKGPPLMLVLQPGRELPLVRPMEGKVELLEFTTVVDAALAGQPGQADER